MLAFRTLSLLSALLVSTAAAQERPAEQAPKPVYDETADARADVAAAVARAKRENKRVLIQWGGNWCGWCVRLAGTMAKDPKLRKELLYEYEVVHVDVGKFDKNKDFAKELGADIEGVPYLTVLDADGKPIAQQGTAEFEVDDKHDPEKVLAWLTDHRAEPLVASEVLAAAITQAKREQKLVFLHFGAPWCGWCHRLEDWMARPEVAGILAAKFVDRKIDVDRMSGGKDVHAHWLGKAGQNSQGIPWFVFLDGDAEIVAHSTAASGNIGFPAAPEEIEHFLTMLRAARVADRDIAKLRATLEEKPPQQQPSQEQH
jgi:thiol-disulfide isomerase/thioredoxin